MGAKFVDLLADGPAHFSAAEPLEAGFDPARLGQLHEFLGTCVNGERLAGLNAIIVRGDRLAYGVSLGLANRETQRPMRADTLFRIYSLSKPVVSVAVLKAVEEGRLLLGDPVHAYIPEIAEMPVFNEDASRLQPQTSEMTIADLLSHTSGLIYGGDDSHPVDMKWNAATLFRRDGRMADVMARLKSLPLKHQPGETFAYGISHDILGLLLERIVGRPLGQILSESVFGPLGMADTGFSVEEQDLDRLAVLYEPNAAGGLDVADPCTRDSRWAAPVSFEAGGEGLVSTVPDFYRFVAMLLNKGKTPEGRYLSRKTVDLMTANRLSESQLQGMWMPGYGFGLGVAVLLDPAVNANLGSTDEFTWAGSASTFFWADPREDLLAILFAQLEPSSSHTIARRFKALMYQALE